MIVFVAAVAPFSPVLRADFTNYDDHANITENTVFRGLSAAHFRWFWHTTLLGVYEPLGWMLKAVIFSAAGLSPRAFHAVSLCLHGLNAVLVFAIARRLLARGLTASSPAQVLGGAAVAALLFGIHPLRCEVVAWASAQPYALSSFFALAATLAYLWGFDSPGASRGRRFAGVGAALLLFTAALLSKTAAISLPLVLLVADVYPLRRIRISRGRRGPENWSGKTDGASIDRAVAGPLFEKLPFLLVAAIFAIKSYGMDTASQIPAGQINLANRLLIAGHAPAFYAAKTLVPMNLSPYYALPMPFAGVSVQFAVGAAAFFLITVGLLLARRHEQWPTHAPARGPCHAAAALTAAWVAALLFIAPASGLVRHGDVFAADRYAYLAEIGLSIAAGGGLVVLWRRGGAARIGSAAGAVIVVAALSPLSVVQSRIWSDSESLWNHALRVDRENWFALNNLANVHLARGEPQRTIELCGELLNRTPRYADATFTMGCGLADLNRLDEAATWFRRTLDIDPMHKAVSNLADVLDRQGHPADAARLLLDRMKQTPNDAAVTLNAGVFLIKAGRAADGLKCMSRAVQLEPTNVDAWFNLGLMNLAVGQRGAAIEALQRCLRLQPGHEKAARYLAQAGGGR